jgi:hypothetical protein
MEGSHGKGGRWMEEAPEKDAIPTYGLPFILPTGQRLCFCMTIFHIALLVWNMT